MSETRLQSEFHTTRVTREHGTPEEERITFGIAKTTPPDAHTSWTGNLEELLDLQDIISRALIEVGEGPTLNAAPPKKSVEPPTPTEDKIILQVSEAYYREIVDLANSILERSIDRAEPPMLHRRPDDACDFIADARKLARIVNLLLAGQRADS